MKKETSHKNPEAAPETKTGRYVYDKKLCRVVKISDEIVGIKKGSPSFEGSCPMKSGGHTCGGGCGCGG